MLKHSTTKSRGRYNKSVMVTLTPRHVELLKEEAKAQGRPVANLARIYIEKGLQEAGHETP